MSGGRREGGKEGGMTLGFVQPPYPADGSRAASASAVEFVFRALDGAAGDE